MDKLNGKKKKRKQQVQEENDGEGDETEAINSKNDSKEISIEEYFKNAREKIEMLKAAMEENDFLDDFDDLGIEDEEDFEDTDSEYRD